MDVSSLIFLSYFRRELPSLINEKKNTLKKFLIFRETEPCSPKLKKKRIIFHKDLPKPEDKKLPIFCLL